MSERLVTGARRAEELNIATQAAEWLRLVQSPDFKEGDKFLAWLRESPLHVREVLLACGHEQNLQNLDPARRIDVKELLARASTNVRPIGEHGLAQPREIAPPRRRARWPMRIAASVAAVSLLGATLAWFMRDSDGIYATSEGEQRNFELDDGSVIFLNTRSRVTVRFSKHSRDIDLQEGQAMFDVEHDATRPFRVHVGAAVIQAVGTQFDVRRIEDRITVAVVEGIVRVSANEADDLPPGLPASTVNTKSDLRAGEAATIDNGHIGASVRIDPDVMTAWRRQQLIFEQAPLAQIVEEFNRYNQRPKLRVLGDEAGALRFNGVFGARNPESLVGYLSKRSDLEFEHRGGEIIIRQRNAAPSAELPAQTQ